VSSTTRPSPSIRHAWRAFVAIAVALVALVAGPAAPSQAASLPVITSISPDVTAPRQQTLTVTGQHLSAARNIRFYDPVSQYESIGTQIVEVSDTGSNFVRGAKVTVGGHAAPVVSSGSTWLLVLLPTLRSGAYPVSVRTSSGISAPSPAATLRVR
jgi:hypothetical protein